MEKGSPTRISETLESAEDVITRIRENPLANQMDIHRAHNDLSLLTYLYTPRNGWSIAEILRPEDHVCTTCNEKPRTIYLIRSTWYCEKHIPRGIAFPMGLHGEAYERYKEGQK